MMTLLIGLIVSIVTGGDDELDTHLLSKYALPVSSSLFGGKDQKKKKRINKGPSGQNDFEFVPAAALGRQLPNSDDSIREVAPLNPLKSSSTR